MKYDIISTGSKGNAVVINDTILIDCGVSFKKLEYIFSTIKIVLLTHIHSDHFNKRTIRLLAKKRPTLRFACGDWLLEELLSCEVDKRNVDPLEIGKKYDYGAFKVAAVKLYHNVPNCGYRIFQDGKKLFYATDTSTLEGITAKDYDLYMIEANYEDEEIAERIKRKTEAGQHVYEYNVLNSHLSKKECDEFILENIGENGVFVYLHQHEE